MTIYDLKPGQLATVISVSAQGAIRRRLLDMGILPSKTLQVARIAPGGGPIWIKLGSSQFALRSQEARSVRVSDDQAAADPTSR
jgi:Fe2+ transport system protein FeoA